MVLGQNWSVVIDDKNFHLHRERSYAQEHRRGSLLFSLVSGPFLVERIHPGGISIDSPDQLGLLVAIP